MLDSNSSRIYSLVITCQHVTIITEATSTMGYYVVNLISEFITLQ